MYSHGCWLARASATADAALPLRCSPAEATEATEAADASAAPGPAATPRACPRPTGPTASGGSTTDGPARFALWPCVCVPSPAMTEPGGMPMEVSAAARAMSGL